jgi:hypothetical protein
MPAGERFTPGSQERAQPVLMADLLAVLGIVLFVVLMLAFIKGLEHI